MTTLTLRPYRHTTMSQPRARFETGQALTEFALIIVFLLLVIFVIVEAARVLFAWNTVQNAAREGARYGITGQFDTDFASEPDPRVASIKDITQLNLAGLPLNEDPGAVFEDDNYFSIEVWGVNEVGQLLPDYAGAPGQPLIVRVTYRVPIVTPILSSIASSIPVFGQVVENNELFGQVGNTSQGQGLPPPLPPLPTPGVTPSPTPSPTSTETPTPGPTDTATATASPTPTATVQLCGTHFEAAPIGGDTFAFVTGEVGDTVILIDLTTGTTLGSDTLVAVGGHDCPGFADFSPPNQVSPPFLTGDVILAQSTNGTTDTAIVLQGTATPTITPSPTLVPSPTQTNTPTITPTPTPMSPFIVLSANCGIGPTVQFTVFGFLWPNDKSVNLFFDGQLQTIIPAGHGGTLPQQTWTFSNIADGDHTVLAVASGGIQDSKTYTVPCADVTPTPATATPTGTPIPADLLILSGPQLVSTPPVVEYAPLDFTLTISNAGDIPVNSQFFVDLYFDPPLVFSNTIPITSSAGYMAVSQLAGQQTAVLTMTTLLGFEGGLSSHQVYGMVDSLHEIMEGVETNNIAGPVIVSNVTPQPSPTPSPTPSGGGDEISGLVRARLGDWFPQNRALVKLIDEGTGMLLGTTFSDESGFYQFAGLAAGTYTVVGCQQIDGVWFQGLRTGIALPPSNPLVDIWMRDQELGICP